MRERYCETEIQLAFVKFRNPLQLPGTIIAAAPAFARERERERLRYDKTCKSPRGTNVADVQFT